MAWWVGASMVFAFFASLERYSYINLNTVEDEYDEPEEAKDRPLMLTKPINHDKYNNLLLQPPFPSPPHHS